MFIPAKGVDFRVFLDALHSQLRFDWYLQVGSQTGRSLAMSRSPTIAVDPLFRFKYDVAGNKPHLHLYQTTSDNFFAAGYLKAMNAKPGFSFLDGMHLFEYLLRDFINTEAAGTRQSVIALHDCCPFGHGMTTRDLDNLPKGPWTGDVWKLIPILKEYRPDLKVEVLYCAPTGLVMVSNLNPKSQVLTKAHDEILARFTDLTLLDFGVEKFYNSFEYVDAVGYANEGFLTLRPAATEVFPPEKPLTGPPLPVPVEPVNMQKISVHNVDLYAGHRVLRDFCHDLARCITAPLSQPVDVYVGVHLVDRPFSTGNFRVGIQTEQYLDRNGQPMWRIPKERFRARHATFYDVLLEFSADNAPAYDFLPEELRRNLVFGPHIFPETPMAPDFQPTPPVFFGSMNERRRSRLAELKEKQAIEVAPHGTFGPPLDALIAQQGAVLNLHFRDGEYSEYPRFLKAYLRGKPLMSEPLAPPLQPGLHYFNLDARPTAKQTEKIFKNLASFAAKHSFRGFLQSAIDRAQARKAG